MKTKTIVGGVIISILLTACGGSKRHVPETIVEDVPILIPQIVDGAVIPERTDDNVLTILTVAGDTLSFTMANMRGQGKVLGTIKENSTARVWYTPTDEDGELNSADYVAVLSDIIGSWVAPSLIEENVVQGVELEPNGIANSINLSGITYKTWSIDDGRLILDSESDGSGVELICSDTFNIEKLSDDSLVIANTDFTYRYGRKK